MSAVLHCSNLDGHASVEVAEKKSEMPTAVSAPPRSNALSPTTRRTRFDTVRGWVGQALAGPYAELRAAIREAPAVNADETGWSLAGRRRP